MIHHFMPLRVVIIKIIIITSVGEDVDNLESLHIGGRNVK